MGFSAEVRETNINWTDADEGIAHVYTCQRRIMRKLRKLVKYAAVRLVESHKDDEGNLTGEEWNVPLELCRHLFPSKKRNVSEAQREAARERMKRARAVRQTPVAAAR